MRSEIKGYKRSKTDCRLLCGELRMRADREEDAVLLAALADLLHYCPNQKFESALSCRMKEISKSLKRKAAKAKEE
jgi:hypothetical protein